MNWLRRFVKWWATGMQIAACYELLGPHTTGDPGCTCPPMDKR